MAEVNGIKSLCIALLMAGIVTQPGALSAQEVKHLNPVIEKLAAGKPFIGFQTGDLSFGNARTMARGSRRDPWTSARESGAARTASSAPPIIPTTSTGPNATPSNSRVRSG